MTLSVRIVRACQYAVFYVNEVVYAAVKAHRQVRTRGLDDLIYPVSKTVLELVKYLSEQPVVRMPNNRAVVAVAIA